MIDAAIYLVGVAAGAYLGVLADRRLRRRRAIRRLRADLSKPGGLPPGYPLSSQASTPQGAGLGSADADPPLDMDISIGPAARPAPWAHRGVMCTERHCMN